MSGYLHTNPVGKITHCILIRQPMQFKSVQATFIFVYRYFCRTQQSTFLFPRLALSLSFIRDLPSPAPPPAFFFPMSTSQTVNNKTLNIRSPYFLQLQAACATCCPERRKWNIPMARHIRAFSTELAKVAATHLIYLKLLY